LLSVEDMIKEVDVDGDGRIDFYGKISCIATAWFFSRKNAGIRVDDEKEILISTFEIHPRNDRWSHI